MGIIGAGEGATRMRAVGVNERAGCRLDPMSAGAGLRRQLAAAGAGRSARRSPAQALNVFQRGRLRLLLMCARLAGNSTCPDCRRRAALLYK